MNYSHKKIFLNLVGTCLFLLYLGQSFGQGVISEFFSRDDSSAVYFFHEDDFLIENKIDTLGHFQRLNPLLTGEIDHQFLGNVGSPHYGLIYEPRFRQGLDLGFHSYDGYLIKRDEVLFYNNRKAYTEATYTAGSQEEATIAAKFSQNFAPRANISLNYRRIVHQGVFQRQRATHSNYTFSTWFHSPNEEYRLLASYAGNTVKQQNNGGIIDDDLLLEPNFANNRNLIPVNLGAAQTGYIHNEISLSQYWNPFAKGQKIERFVMDTLPAPDSILALGDSIVVEKRRIPPPAMSEQPVLPEFSFLRHQITFRRQKIKFFDEQPDPAYYNEFMTNDIGIRHFINMRTLENSFGIRVFIGKSQKGRRPVMFEPGILHQLHWLYQEPEKSTINDLLLTAKAATQVQDWVRLEANGHLNIGNNAGDYLLKGKLVGNLKKWGEIEAGISQQLYAPTVLQNRFLLSEVVVWENDFSKTLETAIHGKYSLPRFKGSVEARYVNINSLIFQGAEALYGLNQDGDVVYLRDSLYQRQSEGSINLLQFIVNKDFELWNFHLENKVAAQLVAADSLDALHLPKVWLRSSFFYENELFKKNLLARIGLDMRYNTDYFADKYMPANGQFYRQYRQELNFYPVVDVFFDFKVDQFRAFFKVENVSQLVLSRSYLTAPGHPGRDWLFKFGLSWAFID